MAAAVVPDRFGITWQPGLAAGILANLDRIDVVEVIAEEHMASSRAMRALETLASNVPVLIHGVALGAASTAAPDERRLDRLARLVNRVRPAFWSEHLACVRSGAIEIGHLAAAPRTKTTIDATAANLARAAAIVGSRPMVENIATLMEPPASDCTEAEWIAGVSATSDCDLLLDLHNLHANGVNFRFDPIAFLDKLNPDRIGAIHLAGGSWVDAQSDDGTQRRYVDDHLHDVPDPVYELLVEVGARVRRPLTVVLERDGRFPAMTHLLWQLERARAALAEGRSRQMGSDLDSCILQESRSDPLLRPEFEVFLAKLYTNASLRLRFLANSRAEAERHGMTLEECDALERIDRVGLELASKTFAHKRALKRARRPWWRALIT